VTDKQRRQRALPSQTLRAAGLSGLDCIGSGGTDRRRSAPPLTALPKPEFPSRRTPPHFQTGSKVFDSHDDGSYYEGEMLKVEFADLDGDGRREMVISGLVCFTDQKVDRVLRREAVVFIYALQPDRTFKQVYRNTDVRIDP
jgi:hypothetical protein